MQEADRPAETDLPRSDDDALAANSAQRPKLIACGESPAVYDDVFSRGGRLRGFSRPWTIEDDLGAGLAGFLYQEPHRLLRHDVRLRGIKETTREAPGEIGLQLCDAGGIDRVMAARHPREPHQLGPVAGAGDDQGTHLPDARERLLPQRQPLHAEGHERGLAGLGLAIGSEHGAGIEAGGRMDREIRSLHQSHAVPCARERQRLPQAEDPGPNDGDVSPAHRFLIGGWPAET